MAPTRRPPRTPWIALPRPPKRLTPPITAAAIEYKTSWPGSAVLVLYSPKKKDPSRTPPRAAVAEHNAKDQMRMAGTLTPARRAASGLPPMAYIYRPKRVRWSTSVQTPSTARTIGITHGTPATDFRAVPRFWLQMTTT